MTTARLQRYAMFLAGFDYKIEYKSTTKHCNADGLSWLPLQQKREGGDGSGFIRGVLRNPV